MPDARRNDSASRFTMMRRLGGLFGGFLALVGAACVVGLLLVMDSKAICDTDCSQDNSALIAGLVIGALVSWAFLALWIYTGRSSDDDKRR
jgi:hypothetical protein